MNLEIGQHWFFWQICNFCHLLILFLTIFYHFDNPEDFWHLRTRIHDNHCNLTFKSDSGQHSQFWRCFQWDTMCTQRCCEGSAQVSNETLVHREVLWRYATVEFFSRFVKTIGLWLLYPADPWTSSMECLYTCQLKILTIRMLIQFL